MNDVIAALVNGTEEYYIATYHTVLDECLDEETSAEEDELPFGGMCLEHIIASAFQKS